MVNAQQWLDNKYPKYGKCLEEFDEKNKGKKRDQITELDISRKSLEGSLDLSGFVDLKKLDCSSNKLISFNVSNCLHLVEFDISNTDISEIDVNKLPKHLEEIKYRSAWGLGWNNKSTQVFSQLKEYEWKDIRSNFTLKLRRRWEEKRFTKEQTKILIGSGIHLHDYDKFEKWKEKGFTCEQIKEWVTVEAKPNDYELVNWIRDYKKLTPHEVKNSLTELRKEYQQVQTWLDWNYPQKQRSTIKELNIDNKKLWSDCVLQDFVNLEKLDCSNNKLGELDIGANRELTNLDCSNNCLINLNLSNNLKLNNLNCSKNQLTNIIFSDYEKLLEFEKYRERAWQKIDPVLYSCYR